MTDSADREAGRQDEQQDAEDPTGRLAAYVAKTQTPLDLLCLLTLWFVIVPPWKLGPAGHSSPIAWTFRLGLSAIYAVDFTIRARLARGHWRYARSHPLGLIVVVIPPLRIAFSLRLIRSVFRRGNLPQFLVGAVILVVNGAIAVYLYERYATGSNIHTVGQSLWWALTTVTTVGYGDYTPVTVAGRIIAGFIMATGILTLAVITAQVASSFVDQGASTPARPPTPQGPSPGEPTSGPGEVTLADVVRRLARIEELLVSSGVSSGRPSSPSAER